MDLHFICEKMQEYSKIPSLTGHEQAFMDYLVEDISQLKGYAIEKRVDCFAVKSIKPADITILVHVDRIPVEPFEFSFNKGMWVGQHDNVISVAIARWLMSKAIPFNFLFTTKEENCQGGYQIRQYIEDHPDQTTLIDLDIDVGVKASETTSGAVSIRKKDNMLSYPEAFVERVTSICKHDNIDYVHKDGAWLICQIGCALGKAEILPKNYSFIGIPLINYHSNKEVASEKCVRNIVKLLTKISERKLTYK